MIICDLTETNRKGMGDVKSLVLVKVKASDWAVEQRR